MNLTIEYDSGETKRYVGIGTLMLIANYVEDGKVQPLRMIPADQCMYIEAMAIAEQRARLLFSRKDEDGSRNGNVERIVGKPGEVRPAVRPVRKPAIRDDASGAGDGAADRNSAEGPVVSDHEA